MTPEELDRLCLSQPGAHKVVQWGDTSVYKVGKKMFAAMEAERETVVLKCADGEMARMLVEAGLARWMPYFGQKQWIGILLGTASRMPADELAARLEASYRMVRSSLTRKEQSELPALFD